MIVNGLQHFQENFICRTYDVGLVEKKLASIQDSQVTSQETYMTHSTKVVIGRPGKSSILPTSLRIAMNKKSLKLNNSTCTLFLSST